MRAGTLHYPLHRPLTTNLFLPAKILQEILRASTLAQKISTNILTRRAAGAQLPANGECEPAGPLERLENVFQNWRVREPE